MQTQCPVVLYIVDMCMLYIYEKVDTQFQILKEKLEYSSF